MTDRRELKGHDIAILVNDSSYFNDSRWSRDLKRNTKVLYKDIQMHEWVEMGDDEHRSIDIDYTDTRDNKRYRCNVSQSMITGWCYNWYHYADLAPPPPSNDDENDLSCEMVFQMYHGNTKRASEIVPGDVLIGFNGEPCKVISNRVRQQDLVQITPSVNSMKPFILPADQILTLVWKTAKVSRIYDVSIPEYIAGYSDKRYLFTQGVDYSDQITALDPYIVGLWLGDGSKGTVTLTSEDQELIDAWDDYMSTASNLRRTEKQGTGCIAVNYWAPPGTKDNPILKELKSYVRDRQPRIDIQYRINSREKRLQMLAGLLDTDGSKESKDRERYTFTTIYKGLKDDVVSLARSLGLRVSYCLKRVGGMRKVLRDGKLYNCKDQWVVSISGNGIEDIPSRLPRKRYESKKRIRFSEVVYGFSTVPIGQGDFHEITVEGDGRVLMSNYMVVNVKGAVYAEVA